jgi:hypothetical protein
MKKILTFILFVISSHNLICQEIEYKLPIIIEKRLVVYIDSLSLLKPKDIIFTIESSIDNNDVVYILEIFKLNNSNILKKKSNKFVCLNNQKYKILSFIDFYFSTDINYLVSYGARQVVNRGILNHSIYTLKFKGVSFEEGVIIEEIY